MVKVNCAGVECEFKTGKYAIIKDGAVIIKDSAGNVLIKLDSYNWVYRGY